jgi:hypothetical protein
MTSPIVIKQSEASAAAIARQSPFDRDIGDCSVDTQKVMRDGAIADAGLEFIQA